MYTTEAKPIPLHPETVHLWILEIAAAAPLLMDTDSLLSTQEMARAEKFRFASDRQRYTVSVKVLRLLCARYLDADPTSISFRNGKYGKPALDSNTDFRFNLSHSAGYAIIGFAKKDAVGVDIEHIRPVGELETIARNFFSPTELKALLSLRESEFTRGFYRCWTRKEAIIKAIGSGLSFPLESFAVSVDDDNHAHLLETQWDPTERSRWRLFSFPPADDYIAAVAVKGEVRDLVIRKWEGST